MTLARQMVHHRGMATKQLTKRPDGRYARQVTYTDPETGVKKRHTVYGSTVKEVNDGVAAVKRRMAVSAPVTDDKRPLEDWLTTWCSTALAASGRSQATKTLYRGLLTTHVVPSLGGLPLGKIKPSDIHRMFLDLDANGLGASSRRNVYAALRAALADAVLEGLLATNPVEKVKRPTQEQTEARSLSPEEVSALLKAARTNRRNRPDEEPRYARAITLLLLTGLRRGELLALKWQHIDFPKKTLKVRGSLSRVDSALVVGPVKTGKSWRTVELTASAVAVLESQRKAQVAERLKAANVWDEQDFVFTTETGAPVDPRNLLRALTSAGKAAGLTDIGLHTLRHTYATTALENGSPIHVVSRNLGHSSINVTVDTYGHVSDGQGRAVSDNVATALGL